MDQRSTAQPIHRTPARKVAAGKPNPVARVLEVIVIGNNDDTESVARSLGELRLGLRRCPDLARARQAASPATSAVVAVTPLARTKARELVEQLVDPSWGGVPVFVVVPPTYPDGRARKLYEAGATTVFEWPTEASLLPNVVADLLGALPRRGDRRSDDALTRAVRARLKLTDLVGDDVGAKVVGGRATLRGHVRSYWKKQRVEHMIMHVPGVVAVYTEDLRVEPSKRSDRDVLRHVRNVLRSVAEIDTKTISVRVQTGTVFLAGTVSSHEELERLENVVANVEGVRAIRLLVTVSRRDAKRARGLASRIRRGIETFWPHCEATATVFGYVAVLTGHVPTLADKRSIDRFVLNTPGIGRVVNKLSVAP